MAASTEDTADSFRSAQGDDIDSEGGLQGASTCSEMSIDEPQDPANQLQGCGPHQDDSGVSSGLVHAAAPSDGSGGSTPPTFPAVTPGAGDAQLARSEASGDALPNISSTPEGSQDSRRDLADSQPPSLDGSGTDSGGASSPRRALAQVLTGAAAHDGTTDDAHAAASSAAGREVQVSAAGASSSTSSGTQERQRQVAVAVDYASTLEAMENRYGRLEQTVARNAQAVEDKFSQMMGMLSQMVSAQNHVGAAPRDAAHAKSGVGHEQPEPTPS
eukprot:SAG11_NODE_4563_length_1849_cov_16.869143_2_plen_273_part_00